MIDVTKMRERLALGIPSVDRRVSAAVCVVSLGLALGVGAIGCERGSGGADAHGAKISINGSTTVAPIMTAAAELYRKDYPEVDITIGQKGTTAGFKNFYHENPAQRTDINNASRTVKLSELEIMEQLELEFFEVPLAYDGLAVFVHPDLDFVDYLTVEELRAIWQQDSTVNNWSQVREGFPDRPLTAFGPTSAHGTFEYFTESICGDAGNIRKYNAVNTPMIISGVQGDPNAIGFAGFAYYQANSDKVRLLGVKDGDRDPVKPTPQTVASLEYTPLSRPLFIYVSQPAAARPAVRAFLDWLLNTAPTLVEDERIGYVALSDTLYTAVKQRLEDGVVGSVYDSDAAHGKNLYQLYNLEQPSE